MRTMIILCVFAVFGFTHADAQSTPDTIQHAFDSFCNEGGWRCEGAVVVLSNGRRGTLDTRNNQALVVCLPGDEDPCESWVFANVEDIHRITVYDTNGRIILSTQRNEEK